MWGDIEAQKIFAYFVRPHPRYRIIEAKRWGIAMLRLPDSFQEYLEGGRMQTLRTNRKHALDSGYRFGTFPIGTYREQAMKVNLSMSLRQGRPMASHYAEEDLFANLLPPEAQIFALLDKAGALSAYAYVPICGEVAVVHYLLGHADHLRHGVMYLLISEVVRELIEQKRERGMPEWLMYDTFYGRGAGLYYFKRRLGFNSHIVRWKWEAHVSGTMKSPFLDDRCL
jgi:GNAT superfamily N-acetyltransferase